MRKSCPANERIKREYFALLKEARQRSESSIDQAAAAIAAFEEATRYKDFRRFHVEQAKVFKRKLSEQLNPVTGKLLAKATVVSRLAAVKAFFHWLAGQPGYKRRVSYSDVEYFNPSGHDESIARGRRAKWVPSLDQIGKVLAMMPASTDVEKRDRAVVAFTLLTGARDAAVASALLRDVDLTARTFDQDARHVRTKFRKTFRSHFFPVGEDIETTVRDWIGYLREVLLFGPDDPLFPKTRIVLGSTGEFKQSGLTQTPWATTQPIRDIFRSAFGTAGLGYANPHSFRDTLVQFGQQVCRTPEEYKAWSQSLGHDNVLTTFTSYGSVPLHREGEIFHAMRDRKGVRDGLSSGAIEEQRALEVFRQAKAAGML